jgi:hypothetical protein
MAVLRAASVDMECCFLVAVGTGSVGLTELEVRRDVRCWRSGDF